ncbi:MAG: hypothetical protein RLZ81_1060 [Pseudomonadota bacterium]
MRCQTEPATPSQVHAEAHNMTLLAKLLSTDLARISSACHGVRGLHDMRQLRTLAEHLDEIRQHAHAVAALTAEHERLPALDFVLHKLEHVRKSSQCLCALYLVDDLFSPVDEARQGNIRILDTVRTGEVLDHYACQCTHCGARYEVEENEYYRTWWAWRVTPTRPLARPAPSQAIAVHA